MVLLVAIAARREDESGDVVNQIRDFGGDARFIKTDVANASEIDYLIKRTILRLIMRELKVNLHQ